VPAKRKSPEDAEEIREYMKLAGEWMRAVRVSVGLSQNQLLSHFTKRSAVFLSDMEAGKTRLTPQFYEPWARAVGLDVRQVAQVMIGFYTPFLYEPLFGEPFAPAKVLEEAPPAFDNMRTAARIKHLRREAGISHIEMAKAIGTSTQIYVTYEDGSRRVPSDQLELLADRLKVPVTVLTATEAHAQGRSSAPD
jgi:transcriptional regulator with XRE-family HTH domain